MVSGVFRTRFWLRFASLKTKAVRDGDHYIINGQKTWTTLGQHADWIFVLVEPPIQEKNKRYHFYSCRYENSGVEVKPIITIDGDHEVNKYGLIMCAFPLKMLLARKDKAGLCKILTFPRKKFNCRSSANETCCKLTDQKAEKIFHDENHWQKIHCLNQK